MRRKSYKRMQTMNLYEANDPVVAYAVAVLHVTFIDCIRIGKKRHRRWCQVGCDWKKEKQKSHIKDAGKGKEKRVYQSYYVPKIYKDLRSMVRFLYGRRFGFCCEVAGKDVEYIRALFLNVMGGYYFFEGS